MTAKGREAMVTSKRRIGPTLGMTSTLTPTRCDYFLYRVSVTPIYIHARSNRTQWESAGNTTARTSQRPQLPNARMGDHTACFVIASREV